MTRRPRALLLTVPAAVLAAALATCAADDGDPPTMQAAAASPVATSARTPVQDAGPGGGQGDTGAAREAGAGDESVSMPAPAASSGLLAASDRPATDPAAWSREQVDFWVLDEGEGDLRAEALRGRALRRSFEGAPPRMPHSSDFGKDCLGCHRKGMAIGPRVAHPMSHAELGSCLQCHIEASHQVFEPGPPERGNAFEGLRPEGRVAGAFQGAPPTVPHAQDMRENCLSCHGEYGYAGLRIDHPRRTHCLQCHVLDGPVADVPLPAR